MEGYIVPAADDGTSTAFDGFGVDDEIVVDLPGDKGTGFDVPAPIGLAVEGRGRAEQFRGTGSAYEVVNEPLEHVVLAQIGALS